MAEFSLLVNIGLMVVAAAFSLYIAKLLKQPALLGYLLAGVIIGPFGLNAFSNPEEIVLLSELGIIFLLFTVGAETDVMKFLRAGPTIFLGGLAQVLLIMLLAFFVLPDLSFEASLYVGLALALSSTMLVVKLLEDKKTLQSLHGQLMLGFLLVQDIVVIVALPLLAAGGGSLNIEFMQFLLIKGIFLLSIVALLSKGFFPAIYRFSARSPEMLYLTALATCFGFIGLAYMLNISLAIGAFLAGLAIARLPYNVEAVASIRGLRDFFVMLFFVSLGTQLNFAVGEVSFTIILSLLVLVFLLKPLALYFVTQMAGYGSPTSVKVSFGLTQMSEFSLILLLQGRISGVVPDNIYSFMLLLAAGSMVITPYLMDFGPKLYMWLKHHAHIPLFSRFKIFSRQIEQMQQVSEKKLHDHVIILGAGRTGKYLANQLRKKYTIIVVDHDPNIIAYCRAKGITAVFGNARNIEILEKLHAENAKLLVCALPDYEETLFVVDFAKHHFHKLKIFAKANYWEDALNLYRRGVDYVVLTEIIGGFLFLEHVEHFLKKGKLLETVNMVKLKENALEEREATHGVKNML